MMVRKQSWKLEVATKDDYDVFSKTPKAITRACPRDGEIRKCTAICVSCPYNIAEKELEQCQNKNTIH